LGATLGERFCRSPINLLRVQYERIDLQETGFRITGQSLDKEDARLVSDEARVRIPQDAISEFCRRNHIMKLSLFGSVLRDDFGPDSDLDILVEFERDYRIGLIALAALELELSKILGRKVDLRSPADLSRYFRDEVLQSAKVQYAKS
jgi:uncharacterized protein